MKRKTSDALLGLAIGDALGVPHEFKDRRTMIKHPASDMTGYGTHNQPPGTWSDDASMTFCLAESLLDNYTLENCARKFIEWRNRSYWTARGEVFDIGMTTNKSIVELMQLIENDRAPDLIYLRYAAQEWDNGNGSLMRILPLICKIKGLDLEDQFDIVWLNSALTHKHIRAAMACQIYLKLVEHLLQGLDKNEAYLETCREIHLLWERMEFTEIERGHFQRCVSQDVRNLKVKDIKSDGYVIHSLEASLWCFLTTNSFQEAVLTAVNLGEDTDTTAAITGGLAGLYYGQKNIPLFWMASLARLGDITDLGQRLDSYCEQ